MDKHHERGLLARIASGDAEAFGELYESYVPRIYRFILFKVSTREEAEDLSAEVFLRAWQYLASAQRQIRSLRAFLFQVARHLVVDYYRQRSQQGQLVDMNVAAELMDDRQQQLFQQVDQSLTVEVIEQALRTLKDEYREIVLLRYVEELSVAEIAEVLGKSRGNVRVTLSRALKLIRNQLTTLPPP